MAEIIKVRKWLEISAVITIIEIITNVMLYCAEIGVCIGRAWEGVFENDYNKIDTSYEMMGHAVGGLINSLAAISLDYLTGTPIYGLMSDLISWVDKLCDKYMERSKS